MAFIVGHGAWSAEPQAIGADVAVTGGVVRGVIGDPEDPTSYEITRRGRGEMVTRLGVDATSPIGLPYPIPEPTQIPGTEDVKLDEYLEEWTDDLD